MGRTFEGELEPEDIVQETLLRAHAKRGQLRGKTEGEAASWLKTILLRMLIDRARQLQRRKEHLGSKHYLDEFVATTRRLISYIHDSLQTSPARALAHEERLLMLTKLLDRLPSPQRQAVQLHHVQQLSLAETAARMGKTVRAVHSLCTRARATFHNLLRQQGFMSGTLPTSS